MFGLQAAAIQQTYVFSLLNLCGCSKLQPWTAVGTQNR